MKIESRSSGEQKTQPQRLWTCCQLLYASGALVGMLLLAACTSSSVPASDTSGLATDPVMDTINATSSEVPSTSTLVPPQNADASRGITESTGTNSQANEFAQQSIMLVNQARSEAGLEPLTENSVLSEVAQSYSQRMASEGFYGHEDPQGRDVTDRIAAADYLAQMSAENIASGQPDAQTVVEGWLNSPGHRANIMNPDLREIGAGYAHTSTPPHHHYWTHVFATPDASVGRDRSRYAELALTQINQLREQAGVEALTLDPTLESIATTHLQSLVESDVYSNQIEPTLNEASQEALQSFQQVVALSAAGPATPEDVVTQWAENDANQTLTDASLRAAGVAYVFVEQAGTGQDDTGENGIEQEQYRHYWLLLLGG